MEVSLHWLLLAYLAVPGDQNRVLIRNGCRENCRRVCLIIHRELGLRFRYLFILVLKCQSHTVAEFANKEVGCWEVEIVDYGGAPPQKKQPIPNRTAEGFEPC